MAKPEWGTKRVCPSCGEKFYDLLREPIVCPHCDSPYDTESASRLKRSRSVIAEESTETKTKIEDDATLLESDDMDMDGDIADSDDDVLEDTSDLGGSADVPGVVSSSDDKEDI